MKIEDRDLRIDAYVTNGVAHPMTATHIPTGASVKAAKGENAVSLIARLQKLVDEAPPHGK